MKFFHTYPIRVMQLSLLLFAATLFSQSSIPTHLERMTYENLLELFNDFDGDSLAQEKIARTYLERARNDGDTIKVARGYDRLARVFQPETNIKYADTLIEYTKDWKHITYPVMGYILKGYELGRLNKIEEKYRYLTLGLDYAKRNDNISQLTYILSELWNIRNKWGNVDKAHQMQKERHLILTSRNYLKKLKKSTRPEKHSDLENIRDGLLLDSYKAFIISFLTLNKIDSARTYLDSLNFKLDKFNGEFKEDYYWWSKDAEIEINYYSGNFQKAIEISNSIFENESFSKSKNNYLNSLLFRGLSEFKLGNIEKALSFLNQVEENKQNFNYLHNNYLKLLFETKLDIYKSSGDKKMQIYCLDQLLSIDSIESQLYKFIEPTLVKEIDTANLIQEKEDLIQELNAAHKKDRYGLLIIGSLLLLVSVIAIFYYRQKVVFKKRFESLLEEKNEEKPLKEPSDALDLAPAVVEDILYRLSKFEQEKHYLDPEITLNSLAKTFQTNSTYLSRVLNHHKQKNFSQYLNGLRVGYALDALKKNATFRKYTIEAIALECGYKNSASFSRSFYRIAGIYPSFYITELNKISDESQDS